MTIPVSIAYEYFDQKTILYKQYFDHDHHDIDIKFSQGVSDLELNIIEIYINKKLIIKSKCSVIAVYNTELSIWQWSWSIPFYTKSSNYIARKLLYYANDISVFEKENEDDVYKMAIFKSELLNSKLHIQWPEIEIEKLLAISLYLTKFDYYIKDVVKKIDISDDVEKPIAHIYYLLKDIIIY